MIQRHVAMKQRYPDRPPTFGVPYEGIEDLRPETQRMLEIFMLSKCTDFFMAEIFQAFGPIIDERFGPHLQTLRAACSTPEQIQAFKDRTGL